jgi:ATPase family protein associated with various cellular activities (AAA)/winged helix domain-containing protein
MTMGEQGPRLETTEPYEDWREGNERYMRTGIRWLRVRLARLGNVESSDRDLTSAEVDLEAAEQSHPPPALLILQQRLGLTTFERNVLLLCAAMELDTRVAALCAEAQHDLGRPYPTFALALALFDDPGWEALIPDRPLRYWRLVEITQPAGEPLTTSRLRVDERIVSYLKGINYPDDRLIPLLTPNEIVLASGGQPSPPSVLATVGSILDAMTTAGHDGRPLLVQLLGTDGSSKELAASLAAKDRELKLFRISAESLPHQPQDLEALARLWERESLLLAILLYVDAHELDLTAASDAPNLAFRRFLDRLSGFVLVGVRDVIPSLGRASVAIDVAKPTTHEQRALWKSGLEAIGTALSRAAPALASQFDLSIPDIQAVIDRASLQQDGLLGSDAMNLWDLCLSIARPRMDVLAHRLTTLAAWDDIVLPETEMSMLREIAGQVQRRSQVYEDWGWRQRMNRGLGVSVLFAGESGTGKTMAAEVLANGLHLDLYRIDLSAVVDKYIGETEKNLRRVFDAAEGSGVILFFDEADALFGKRSEVKDSHDRYANIETGYLLQRMEAYKGLAILATNMKRALDSAFLRRLRFIINFAFPGPAQRRAIWERSFPKATPIRDLDFGRLAKLNLTGGSIHNVALNASFLAAREGGAVTMRHALDAARNEFRKLDRPINETDFT